MRIKRGATVEETVAEMNSDQRRALATAERNRERELRDIEAAMNRTRASVARAMEVGVPARILAERLGVTHGRVYQMRDEARDVLD